MALLLTSAYQYRVCPPRAAAKALTLHGMLFTWWLTTPGGIPFQHSHSLLLFLFVCLDPPGSLRSKEKLPNKLVAVEIQWPVPTLKKYSSSRLKVDKYHISIQVMQTWALHVFNYVWRAKLASSRKSVSQSKSHTGSTDMFLI